MEYDGSRAALLAIDLQRAFCSPEGSVARQGRDVSSCRAAMERCIDLADAARRVGVPVIWTRIVLRPDYADGGVFVHELRPGLKEAGGLQAGTDDVELMPEVQVHKEDHVVDKRRYSAFHGTGLEDILRARRIECLMVGGVTTSMCVESTVRDAGQRDYKTFVVRDACADFSDSRHGASFEAIAFGFGRVISHNEALSALAAGKADL